MGQVKNFLELSREEKTAFFQRCQDILVKNHPRSEFILRKEAKKKTFYLDLYLQYKGFAYESEKVALLFNKIKYIPEEWHQTSYENKVFDFPSQEPNCYCIDFVTANMSPSLIEELKPHFNENLEYIGFMRNNTMSFFNFKNFLDLIHKRYNI